MTIRVKKKLDRKKSAAIISSLPEKIKPVNLTRYTAKWKWKNEDPLRLQKAWRDE
jgi:hypothetical protein